MNFTADQFADALARLDRCARAHLFRPSDTTGASLNHALHDSKQLLTQRADSQGFEPGRGVPATTNTTINQGDDE